MDCPIFYCKQCTNILDDPVECKNCNTNYCKKHIKHFKKCPSCNNPFIPIKNLGLINILNEHIKMRNNFKIQLDNNIYKCKLCYYEGKANDLCIHLSQEHKKELISNFGEKKENNTVNKIIKDIENNIPLNENNITNLKESIIENPIIYDNQSNENEDSFNQYFNNKEKENEFKSEKQDEKTQFYIKANSQEINVIESKNNVKKQIPVSKSQKDEIYYSKNYEIKKCDCPSHNNCIGNCICIKCMKYNVKKMKLNNYELINKAGRIAKLKMEYIIVEVNLKI